MIKLTILTLFCSIVAGSEAEELKVVVERNVPVPMRDGTILRADVYRPDRGGPYPVLVKRTPYDKSTSSGECKRFVKAGYIVVCQDVRGRYESEGKWESMFRLQTHDAEDGYDTVEWAAKLSRSTGKVGTWGFSYPGMLQWRLAPLCPPSLVAMSASGTGAKSFLRETGAMPPTFLYWWVVYMTPDMRRRANRPGVHAKWEAGRLWSKGKSEKWLNFSPTLQLPKEVFEDEEGPVKYLLKNPRVDYKKLDEGCKDISVPNFEIAGWYDEGNGKLALYKAIVKQGKNDIVRKGSRIIIGPWSHGIYRRHYGNIDFGPFAVLDRIDLQVHWFDYWLKDIQNGVDKNAPVKIFVMGDNQWRDEQSWPLQRAKEKIMYIRSEGYANTPSGDGKLVDKRPQQLGEDEYAYDPKSPVPSLSEGPSQDRIPADQRPLAARGDILVYQTKPLIERIEVTGDPVIELYASSSASDTDWCVKLIDVSPDGLARNISEGLIRARFRFGVNKPESIKPGEIVKYTIYMTPTSNAFLPGHRIRIDITSSDFPDYDRNHNTAVDQNADATLVVAYQTIFHGGVCATRIILPWVPNLPKEEKLVEKERVEEGPEKRTYPLHQAAASGDAEQVRMLISKGSNINSEDKEKNTPLGYAVKSGNMDIVKLLVDAGADVNRASEGTRLPLFMAVVQNNIVIAEYLIAHGANVDAPESWTPLQEAVYIDYEMVKLLIAKGADINVGPWTPLHGAASVQKGRDIVELLIRKGADINVKGGDRFRSTPLLNAVRHNNKEIAELLIANGAKIEDLNSKDDRGLTALHDAVVKGRQEIAELLLSEGANVNAKDNKGVTPLGEAISTNNEKMAELLIANGAKIEDLNLGDLNSKNDRGLTALHNAAVEGYQEIAEILLSKGAKVDERDDNYEFTALHYAARFGTTKVAEVLIAHGADIKAKDKWAYEPIHWAAYHDRPEIIELLIAHGADVNVKTSLGQTPLELAIPMRNTAAIEVLRKHGAKE